MNNSEKTQTNTSNESALEQMEGEVLEVLNVLVKK